MLGTPQFRGAIDRFTLNVGSIMIVDAVDRLTLNVGGRRFETTASTLGAHGSSPNFFTQLIAHDERRAGGADAAAPLEYFVDRDGDAFAPVLNYLRTGQLHVPAGVSEASVREEAAFYCVPLPPARPTHAPGPQPPAQTREAQSTPPQPSSHSHVVSRHVPWPEQASPALDAEGQVGR